MGRRPNQVRTTGISIFGLAFILLTFMFLPFIALLRATKGTRWHKFVVIGLMGLVYYCYMDMIRVNKCNSLPSGKPCPMKIEDFLPSKSLETNSSSKS